MHEHDGEDPWGADEHSEEEIVENSEAPLLHHSAGHVSDPWSEGKFSDNYHYIHLSLPDKVTWIEKTLEKLLEDIEDQTASIAAL